MKRLFCFLFTVILLLSIINVPVYSYVEFEYKFQDSNTYTELQKAVEVYNKKYNIDGKDGIIYSIEEEGKNIILAEYNQEGIEIPITVIEKIKTVNLDKTLRTILDELQNSSINDDYIQLFINDICNNSSVITHIFYPMNTRNAQSVIYNTYKVMQPFLEVINILIVLILFIYIIYLIIKFIKKRESKILKRSIILVGTLIIYVIVGGITGIISLILTFL